MNFEKKSNLLITGGCGFIGSNFINHIFYTNKYNIINLDALYYCADENNVNEDIRNHKNYTLIKGNICSEDIVNHILKSYNIEYVIHFAAQSHVQNSFSNALQYTKDNIMGTHILLECCHKYGKIKKFIHVSTDEVYGESMLDLNEQSKTEYSIPLSQPILYISPILPFSKIHSNALEVSSLCKNALTQEPSP